MAFNLNSESRKLSGDSALFFDDNLIPTSTEIGSTSPSLSLSPRPLRLSPENYNGFQPSGTLLDGILQNLSIWGDVNENKNFCTCGEGILATSYCSVCKDYLCDKCVSAHNRVKVTRDHPVQRINAQATDLLSRSNSLPKNQSLLGSRQFQFNCDEHAGGVLHLFCEICSVAICDQCANLNHGGHRIQHLQHVIDGSRAVLLSLISQSRAKAELFEKISGHILAKIKGVQMHTGDICLEIKTVFRKLSTLLEQREQELISNVQQIQEAKYRTLNSCFNEVCERSNNLKKLTEDVQREVEFSNGMDILKAKERLAAELMIAEKSLAKNSSQTDEKILFVPPDSTVVSTMNQLGKIVSQASSPPLTFSAPARTTASDMASLIVGQHLTRPEAENAGKIGAMDPRDQTVFSHRQLLEKQDDFSTIAIPFQDSKQKFSTDLRDILKAPPSQTIRVTKPRFSFGGMGENDGQLCRPWGVACDRHGNYIVADRSNNRIQVFSPNGTFLRKFGVAGSQQGQFNRPAGLSVDVRNRIIVADKDNHRIQVFSLDGDFLFTFGERGSKNSQFYYPWDIATDSRGLIAVTDTRNHRIQIFNPNGKFIGKYGFEGILWKHFDSPRGISFANNDTSLVVTDFNNHRLVIIQSDLQSARFLGSEGSQLSQFLRPQGVVVDSHGNYIVADSRNNRLQIFSPSGTIIAILGGTQGSATDEMDRPSGVAVAPDGGIVVVDFGNNRVLVY